MSTPTTFYLSTFDSSVQMDLCGNMDDPPVYFEDVSCSALIFVDVSAMQHMFQYATDASGISNITLNTGVKYYVNALSNSQLATLNLACIQVDPNPDSPNGGSPIASPNLVNGNSVGDDFVRYLALSLFNTFYGADLFNDQAGLVQDLEKICGLTGTPVDGSWNTGIYALDTIWNSLNLYDATTPLYESASSASISAIKSANGGLAMGIDDLGRHYITNDHDTGLTNLTRTVMQQMTENHKSRFYNIVDTYEAQPLPFIVDDVLDFKFSIAAAPGQELLTGVGVIAPRSYRIQLKMKASGTVGNAFNFSGTV